MTSADSNHVSTGLIGKLGVTTALYPGRITADEASHTLLPHVWAAHLQAVLSPSPQQRRITYSIECSIAYGQ